VVYLRTKCFEIVPAGWYRIQLLSVEEGPPGSNGNATLKWHTRVHLLDGSSVELSFLTSTSFNRSSDPTREAKAYKVCHALNNGNPPPLVLDPNDYRGRRAMARIEVSEKPDGRRYSQPVEFKPLVVPAGTGAAAELPHSAFADYAAEADAADTEDVPF